MKLSPNLMTKIVKDFPYLSLPSLNYLHGFFLLYSDKIPSLNPSSNTKFLVVIFDYTVHTIDHYILCSIQTIYYNAHNWHFIYYSIYTDNAHYTLHGVLYTVCTIDYAPYAV